MRAKKQGSTPTRDTLCMEPAEREHHGRTVRYFCSRPQHGDTAHQAVTDDGPLEWVTRA